eukprot:SAG31_NODE_552_length_14204_cov_14.295356_8_plen_484_part_00
MDPQVYANAKRNGKRRGTADFYSTDFQANEIKQAALLFGAEDDSDDGSPRAATGSTPDQVHMSSEATAEKLRLVEATETTQSKSISSSVSSVDSFHEGPEDVGASPVPSRSMLKTLELLTKCDLQHLVPSFKRERITFDTLGTLVSDKSATERLGVRVGDLLRLKKGLSEQSDTEMWVDGALDRQLVDDDDAAATAGTMASPDAASKTPVRRLVRRNSFEAWLDDYQCEQSEAETAGKSMLAGSVSPAAIKAISDEFYAFKDSAIIEDVNEIELGMFIADGTSGAVYQGRWRGMACAVKRFHYNSEDVSLATVFRNEVFLLRNLNHDNLLRFYGACTRAPNLCIVTELLVGSLSNLLYGSQSKRRDGTVVPIGMKRQLHIAHGVANGLAFLHSHSVAHRDLKGSNVLYDRQLNVRLCDFAFSKFKQQQSGMASQVGTPAWMAPEVLRGEEYSLSADMYSYGVVLWELTQRREPLKHLNQYAVR